MATLIYSYKLQTLRCVSIKLYSIPSRHFHSHYLKPFQTSARKAKTKRQIDWNKKAPHPMTCRITKRNDGISDPYREFNQREVTGPGKGYERLLQLAKISLAPPAIGPRKSRKACLGAQQLVVKNPTRHSLHSKSQKIQLKDQSEEQAMQTRTPRRPVSHSIRGVEIDMNK
jgi:hypothetical protein